MWILTNKHYDKKDKLKELYRLAGYTTIIPKMILVRSDFSEEHQERAEELVMELNNGELSHAWYF